METPSAVALGIIIGLFVGITICCLCRSGKIASMQSQLEQKKDSWCAECPVHKRLQLKNDLVADREAYIKTLEERCATLTKSNRQLGMVVQKKSWRVA